MTESTDIWQEGADESRECGDCGHTSHSCTCYEVECKNCLKVVDPADATMWNGEYFCPGDTCLELFINN